jgi:hypothetical protein
MIGLAVPDVWKGDSTFIVSGQDIHVCHEHVGIYLSDDAASRRSGIHEIAHVCEIDNRGIA